MATPCKVYLKDIFPDDVYVVCGDTAAIKPGDTTFTIAAFVNWKARMSRGGLSQFFTDPETGNTFFDYSSITGQFTFPAAQDEEEFIFMAYKPTV